MKIPMSQALELSMGGSSSSSTKSQSLTLSQKIAKYHRLTLGASTSKDSSNTSDGSASSVKGSYSYRFPDSGISLRVGVKKTNDYYLYEGLGADFKATFPVYEFENEDLETLTTKLGFKIDTQLKTYTPLSTERYLQRALTISADQDLTPQISIGLEFTNYNYATTSKETTAAFNASTTTYSDISSFVSQTNQNSVGFDIEYAADSFATGVSVSKSNPQVSGQTSYTSYDVFVEYTFFESLNTTVNFSRGKSEGSTSYSDTWGFGFGWTP